MIAIGASQKKRRRGHRLAINPYTTVVTSHSEAPKIVAPGCGNSGEYPYPEGLTTCEKEKRYCGAKNAKLPIIRGRMRCAAIAMNGNAIDRASHSGTAAYESRLLD